MATTMEKTKWAIDPAHSEVHFKVKHLVISTTTGSFKKFSGSVEAVDDDFSQADVQFSIEADSVNTDNADRDNHLKSTDFFDAANHPSLDFKGAYADGKLKGDLTIRGTTKPITLDVDFGGVVKDPWGNTKAGFEITGKLNRKDYGLTWSALTESGGLVVADEIKLSMNIELAKS